MLRYSLSALAGAWSLQLSTRLPPDRLLPFAAAAAALLLWPRRLRGAGCFLAGACLVWFAADRVIDGRLPPALEGQTLSITGRVLDFTDARANPLRFLLAVDAPGLPSRLRVSWYDAPAVPRIGETWALELRLWRPRGFSNPLHFDYEHWLFRQHIGATGYVVNGGGNARLDAPVDVVSALRKRLADRMLALLGHNSASAVLLAITVGATHEISREEWDRYAVTGTSHLMAISGMNIAMAAGGACLLAWVLLAPLCRRASVRDLAGLVAVAAAVAYAEISGFAIPVRRAMLMALLVFGAALLKRQLRAAHLFGVTCLAIIATDPLSVHAPGFKLSFAAVAILLWAARQWHLASAAAGTALPRRLACAGIDLTALQFTLLLGLLPLTVMLFGRISWPAPLVNMLVLPLFNLVTVPAALLGLLFDGPLRPVGDGLLLIAWHSVRAMLWIVDAVAAWPRAHTPVAFLPPSMWPVACLPALWAVAPPGFPGRKLAWIAAAAVVLYRPAPPPAGCVEVTALDVGQGLSVVLRTFRRTLVYDTGPSFRSGSDTGALVVAPYLEAAGVRRIDLLVVSHADADHAGGAGSVLEALAVGEIYAGERLPISRVHRRCRTGEVWVWDGVRFVFLHPPPGSFASGNDASCVLEIAVGEHRVLLTGDIEGPAERRLLQSDALRPTDLVVIPHHGSATSSGPELVRRLHPQAAVVSAGYDNRWGFPKDEVVARWRAAGARVLNTATSGAIEYRVCPDTGVVLQYRHRLDAREYWHE